MFKRLAPLRVGRLHAVCVHASSGHAHVAALHSVRKVMGWKAPRQVECGTLTTCHLPIPLIPSCSIFGGPASRQPQPLSAKPEAAVQTI